MRPKLTVARRSSASDFLSAPLNPDWSIDRLAEDMLRAIAEWNPEESREFVFDAGAITDRQSLRLIRPLLACLATKAAAESGTPSNLYGGPISFKRPGREGPVWIFGEFENTQGVVRVSLFRIVLPPESPGRTVGNSPLLTGTGG